LPAAATRPARADTGRTPLRAEIGAGLAYLRGRPGLLGLVVVFGVYNFLFAVAGGTVQPLILSFAGPATLGALMFAGGSGLFVGSLVMGAWGGPRRRIDGVYLGLVLGGVFLALHSVRPSPWLIAVVAPAFLFTLPVMNTACITLVQTKVPADVLGRVLAAVRVVTLSAMPLAYLVVGPLTDGVFEPLMSPGGPLAGTVGALIGVGHGRGIALMFLVDGLLLLALAAYAYTRPRIRHIDDELPDTVQPGEDSAASRRHR